MIQTPAWTRHLATALWLALALLFAAGHVDARTETKPAKYVFLFIGDGLAISQRSSAEYYLAAKQSMERPGMVKLTMNGLPAHGATTTYSLNSIITDSAAAGTALACGVKTYNGGIGLDGTKTPVKSVAEMARDTGRKVGIVSTVSLDHATPASFYAHRPSRNDYYEIALQLPDSGFDYFAGGGFRDPQGKHSKQSGDKPDALENMKAKGYTLVNSQEAVLALKPGQKKIVAVNPVLDSQKAMPYTLDADPARELTLAQFTAKGIELLDNPRGFFMMVEGGKVDWACHANDAVAVIHDVLALDAAVAEAVQFAAKHPAETLIVVTGDHETGGMSLGFAGTRYGNYYQYLNKQTMSFLAFSATVREYAKAHTPENARFEDMGPLIARSFGLVVPTEQDLAAMKNAPKADEDTTSPPDPYGMHFKGYELAMVKLAFTRSMSGENVKARADDVYLAYGEYDPLTMVLTRILDAKAGLGWTTYAHTGMPVLTSASGPGSQAFGGHYDNTDLSRKLMAALGVEQKAKVR